MGKESYLLGRLGEDVARSYLVRQGFRVVDTNFHSQQGEVDIIAQEGEVLVFVEVKSYSYRSYGSPVGAVKKSKRQSLAHAAKTYLAKKNIRNTYCRFDVLTIYRKRYGEPIIEHYRNAFTLSGR